MAGEKAWDARPPERQRIAAEAMPNVSAEFAAERRAGRAGTSLLDLFAVIDAPVLYLTGTRTKASARRIGQLLPAVWKDVRFVELDGPGHIGPVTHPDLVNQHIEAFLEANRYRGRLLCTAHMERGLPMGLRPEQAAGYLEEVEREWGGRFGIAQRCPSIADDARFRQW